MIKVILKGALGNQLFQYAHGKALSLKYDVPLTLDLSFLKARVPLKFLTPYKGATYRDYDLSLFEIEDKTETLFYNDLLDMFFAYPATFLINKLINKNFTIEGEDPYIYNPEVAKKGPNIMLNGYWNNYKYFDEYADEIKKILDTEKLYESKFEKFEKGLREKENSVSIHIRRGDYLNSRHKNVYLALDDYYIKAVKYIKSKVSSPFFYIFSESDAQWLEKKLNLKKSEYKIVSNKLSGHKNKSHFRFMSLCKHNVIANSSYSWWAAYLNKNNAKIVVAPSKWQYKYEFENLKDWVEITP